MSLGHLRKLLQSITWQDVKAELLTWVSNKYRSYLEYRLEKSDVSLTFYKVYRVYEHTHGRMYHHARAHTHKWKLILKLIIIFRFWSEMAVGALETDCSFRSCLRIYCFKQLKENVSLSWCLFLRTDCRIQDAVKNHIVNTDKNLQGIYLNLERNRQPLSLQTL